MFNPFELNLGLNLEEFVKIVEEAKPALACYTFDKLIS